MWAFKTRTRLNNRGQANLEFLLSAIVLLTTILAAVQLIVMIYTFVLMAEGAKQGVRYAIVHGSTSTVTGTTAIENAVKRYVNYPGMNITVCYPDGVGGGCAGSGATDPSKRVEVTLSYPFNFLSLGWALPTIRASARGRIFH
jgi:uncharacterized protein (UPF0333 family)